MLEDDNYKVLCIHYADYLKFIANHYLGWDGNKDEKGRTLLQFIGVDKVRAIYPNFWVDTVIRFVKVFEDDYDYILIGDCRFENEIMRWKEEDYKVVSVHVERIFYENGLTEEQKNHSSETALDDFDFDSNLIASSLFELENEIRKKLLPRLMNLH